jgi:glycosyltransferase involved in cell wall biosynthesis
MYMGLRILVVSCEWPSQQYPFSGIFVKHQVETLREFGLDVNVFTFRGGKKLLSYARAIFDLGQWLRINKVDVIHAHFGQAGFVALTQRKVPVVVTLHGSDIYGVAGKDRVARLQSYLLEAISRITATRANEVIVVSERMGKLLPKRNYHVIPIGIDTKLFKALPKGEARRHLGWTDQEKTVLFVGDPQSPIKRYHLASQVVESLRGEIVDIKLRVAFNVLPEQMPYYMNASDVLLVTSVHEGGPLVVREALACDLPVVSVDVGDVRKRIELVDGCIVCNDDRPDIIADAVKQVLCTGKRINGRASVSELDERVLIQKVIGVYRDMLIDS